MKVDISFAKLPWHMAVSKIIYQHELDLEPCLVIRGDDPGNVSVMNQFIKSHPNSFYVKLGKSNSLAYLDIELLSQLEPGRAVRLDKAIDHETVIRRICKVFKRLPFTPVIICDRCNHLNSPALFRILRFINELEGKAQFVFILPELYLSSWISTEKTNLKYFLKIVKSKYVIYD